MIWFKLALSILQLILFFARRNEQLAWINEGERRAQARQLKELTDAIATAARIDKELEELQAEELQTLIEAEGWYRD